MKNIHVLSTDKPSRLFEILQFNFVFDNQNKYSTEYKKLHKYKNKHIYITNDEEIKDGDWFLDDNNQISRSYRLSHVQFANPKKIILTTDQDLIKDGVWGIEDGFVEWFVKNPTCEYVELKGYAIVLPGESCDCDIMCSACKEEVIDGLTMGQIPANEETREYDLLQHIKFCLECKNESQAIRLIEKYGFQKQETLEDKLESLVVQWHQRQLRYEEVADDNIANEHNNRKFTYKAMATRDCWKELLTLLNEFKKRKNDSSR